MQSKSPRNLVVSLGISRPRSTGFTRESLFAEHGDCVYRFCLRLCAGNSTEAEDLAQDALLLAWNSRAEFEGRSSVSTYLYRIAINRYQRVRSRADAVDRCKDAVVRESVVDPTQEIAGRLDLEQALQSLSEDFRTAFLLVKSEGLTYREAATVLGIPQGTVQSRVHDATMRLRAYLGSTSDSSTAIASKAPHEGRKEKCHAV